MKTMKINKKLISFWILTFLILVPFGVLAHSALAQTSNGLLGSQVGIEEVGQKFGATGGINDVNDPRVIAMEIINVVLGFLSLLLVALLVFSGYQWMAAGGNEEQVTKAQKRITNAVIGLVIVLAAWSIGTFLLKRAICVTGSAAFLNYPMCVQ